MVEEILSKKWKLILELGVGSGHSTIALLIACYLNKGRLISCDIQNIHRVDEWLKKFDCQFLEEYWQFHCCYNMSLEFNKKFDMIFLDASHEYVQTKQELRKFSKLTDVLYCHDYGLSGVAKPVLEFVHENPEWHLKVFNTPVQLAKLTKT